MKVRYTWRAADDIIAIAGYIRDRNPSTAQGVEKAIRSTIGHLAEHPNLGTDRPELGARALGVPRFTYMIYYRVRSDQVEIMHVRDARRRPPAAEDIDSQ